MDIIFRFSGNFESFFNWSLLYELNYFLKDFGVEVAFQVTNRGEESFKAVCTCPQKVDFNIHTVRNTINENIKEYCQKLRKQPFKCESITIQEIKGD